MKAILKHNIREILEFSSSLNATPARKAGYEGVSIPQHAEFKPTIARRWQSAQEEKAGDAAVCGSCSQLSKRHWSVQSEFVSNTLAGFRVLLHPSAEERLATHTPIRENDVDHFWAYWGTWYRFSADGREVASARCSALEVPRVIQDGGVERIWTGPLSTLVAPAALST